MVYGKLYYIFDIILTSIRIWKKYLIVFSRETALNVGFLFVLYLTTEPHFDQLIPWTENIDYTYKKRQENVLDIF